MAASSSSVSDFCRKDLSDGYYIRYPQEDSGTVRGKIYSPCGQKVCEVPDLKKPINPNEFYTRNKSKIDKAISIAQKTGLITNSDGEFSEDELADMPPVIRDKSIEVVATTISCVKGNIKGSKLLEIVSGTVKENYFVLLKNSASEDSYRPEITDSGALKLKNPIDWLMTLGGWKNDEHLLKTEIPGYLFSSQLKENAILEIEKQLAHGYSPYSECLFDNDMQSESTESDPPRDHENEDSSIKTFGEVYIYSDTDSFKIVKNRISINDAMWFKDPKTDEKKSIKDLFKRLDLTYKQIVDLINRTKKQSADDQIAELQLLLLQNKSTTSPLSSTIKTVLNYLNALMFGVEASGINAGLATGLMTLELIKNKNLTYSQAFHRDDEGGSYPFACRGDNKGTFGHRNKVAYDAKPMGTLRDSPKESPIALKEIIIIKQWLKTKGIKSDKTTTKEDKLKAIKIAILELLTKYFLTTPVTGGTP